MRSVDSIAEDYVERAAVLDPALATFAGIAGHDGELPDLSADGFAERAGLDRSTLAALGAAEAPGLREQTARAAMQERLAVAVERYDAGDTTSDLNVIDSWVQYVRELFDLMPAEGEEAAATVARRMAAVPDAYRQFSQTLLGAARNGRPPARLQVEEVAKQCAAWATPEDSCYGGLVKRLTGVPDSLRGELDAAAREATAATARLGGFLRLELLPLAREKDACGPEVYARASRYFLGAAVDLAEAYAGRAIVNATMTVTRVRRLRSSRTLALIRGHDGTHAPRSRMARLRWVTVPPPDGWSRTGTSPPAWRAPAGDCRRRSRPRRGGG